MRKYMVNEGMSCKWEICNTLSYRAVFKYPLSFYQLATFLISSGSIDFETFSDSLMGLMEDNLVNSKGDKYFLEYTRPLNWESRAENSRSILEKHKDTFDLLGKIPWIKMLAVTGSTAAYNFETKGDLDVFIITQNNRLWITRLFTVLLLRMLGVYRTDKDPAGKVCPNLYLSEDSLTWDSAHHNFYIAHEIVMMHPLINRDDMYFRFVKSNEWVFDYFGNVIFDLPDYFPEPKTKGSLILNLIERIFMVIQQRYMQKRKTVEVTSKNIIHFNRRDTSKIILSKYEKYLIKLEKLLTT